MTVRARTAATPVPTVAAPAGVPGRGDLPAALVVVLAVDRVSLATVAGWLGGPCCAAGRSASRLLLVASVVGVVLVVDLRPPTTRVGGAARARARPARRWWSRPRGGGRDPGCPAGLDWFLNGDHPRHAVYAADTWVQGNLAYAVEGYPRGWHSVLAAAWSVVGAGLDPASVVRLSEVMAVRQPAPVRRPRAALAHLGHALRPALGLGGDAAIGWASSLGRRDPAQRLPRQLPGPRVRELPAGRGRRRGLLPRGARAGGDHAVARRLRRPASWSSPTRGSSSSRWSRVAALWCARVALRRRERRAAAVVAGAARRRPGPRCARGARGRAGASGSTTPPRPDPTARSRSSCSCSASGRGVVARAWWRDGAVPRVRRRRHRAPDAARRRALAAGWVSTLLHYYPSKLLWQSALLGLPWVAGAGALLLDRLATARPRRRRGRASGRDLGPRGARDGLRAPAALGFAGRHVGRRSTGAASWARVTTPGRPEPRSSSGSSGTPDDRLDDPQPPRRAPGGADEQRAPQARLTVAQECALLREAARPVVLSTASGGRGPRPVRVRPRRHVIPVTPAR